MAQRGFVVVINDHLGHGRSVTSGALYGHFGEKGGLYNVVEDQRNLQSIMREKYPELPYFLMGHSMGSFIAREFAAAYGNSLTADRHGPVQQEIQAQPHKLRLGDE